MNKVAKEVTPVNADEITNAAEFDVAGHQPYVATVNLRGTSDMLFHRWNAEAVDEKAAAAKNSVAKKTDNIESYIWRDENGDICVPGDYLRGSVILAAKYKQDPRSPRKSAMDLFRAGVVAESAYGSLGTKKWDYEDRRRVVVQRNGINRVRPAMRAGWECELRLMVLTPEYINRDLLLDVIGMAGRLVGLGDYRPTYGRFSVTGYRISDV